jgi:uracil phosphoribosyltransferase
MHRSMDNLTVVDHPLLKRDLTILRSQDTSHGTFRRTVSDAATVLACEAMRDLSVRETPVDTPLETTTGHAIDEEVIVVPIMRAGLGMVDGFVRFLPEARVAHLGMERDEETHQPVNYYSSVPSDVGDARVFVVDPMLATGGSAAYALRHLEAHGAENVVMACLVAAPEGVKKLADEHPGVTVLAAALDRELDDDAFIRPGLGDAGDRIYGTR